MGRNYKDRKEIQLNQDKVAGKDIVDYFIETHYEQLKEYINQYYRIKKDISEEDMKHMLISIFDELKDVLRSNDLPVYTLPYIGKFMPVKSRVIVNYINVKANFIMKRVSPFIYAHSKIVYGNFFKNYKGKTEKSLKFNNRKKETYVKSDIEIYVDEQARKKAERFMQTALPSQINPDNISTINIQKQPNINIQKPSNINIS